MQEGCALGPPEANLGCELHAPRSARTPWLPLGSLTLARESRLYTAPGFPGFSFKSGLGRADASRSLASAMASQPPGPRFPPPGGSLAHVLGSESSPDPLHATLRDATAVPVRHSRPLRANGLGSGEPHDSYVAQRSPELHTQSTSSPTATSLVSKVSRPPVTSHMTVSPSANSPSSRCSARTSTSSFWISRFSGRAP